MIQLITGATGLSDWEWGVTLLSDDPKDIKDIVYEMRFDEVSARYGMFGAVHGRVGFGAARGVGDRRGGGGLGAASLPALMRCSAWRFALLVAFRTAGRGVAG